MSLDQESEPTCALSRDFKADDADVTFKSSDNILFKIHRKNLETNTGGFPPSDFDTRDEIVPLTEDSSTLKLPFQYIYPSRQPEIEKFPFQKLAPLAEAAEKYEVYPAMYVCKTYMKNHMTSHPVEVLEYAARHDYDEIVDQVAPGLLDKPFDELVAAWPMNLMVSWTYYRNTWDTVLKKARSFPNTWERLEQELSIEDRSKQFERTIAVCPVLKCRGCFINVVAYEFLKDIEDFESLRRDGTTLFTRDIGQCVHLDIRIRQWRKLIRESVRAVPPFTKFLHCTKSS